MFKQIICLSFILISFGSWSQKILKESLTPSVRTYWDADKKQIQSVGSHYKDKLGMTSEKHGKWLYYDRFGTLEEERHYYRDKLNGRVMMLYPNKKPRQEGYFKMDKQDSVYREWNETGKLSKEGMFKLGEPVGTWKYYYLDGRLKSVEEISKGTTYIREFWMPDSSHTKTIENGNGEMADYFTTGALKNYYTFKDGLKHGSFEERSIYGYQTLTGNFDAGEKDGEWKFYYYTGDLEKVSHYKNGLLEGEYQYFYDNGQLNVQGQYLEGKKDGLWTWYTKTGNKDQEGTFVNDMQDGEWTYWYPSGEMYYKAHFTKNLKSGHWKYWYKDGSKFKEGDYSEDKKHGLWQTWYENGQLLMTGKYVNGKEEGEWKNYWDNGVLKNMTTFKAGEMNGKWLSNYPSGKVKLTGFYENNFKTGEWIDYFENGNQKDIVTYKVFKTKSKMDYGIMKGHEVRDSKKHGHAVSFSQKDFKKTEEGDYKEGEKDGVWTAYYPGGKIAVNVSTYKNGKLDGVMKQYTRRGVLTSEIEYKNGLKHGKFVIYDSRGNAIKEKTFENGMEVKNRP